MDVDKWDYIIRDSYHTGKFSFQKIIVASQNKKSTGNEGFVSDVVEARRG